MFQFHSKYNFFFHIFLFLVLLHLKAMLPILVPSRIHLYVHCVRSDPERHVVFGSCKRIIFVSRIFSVQTKLNQNCDSNVSTCCEWHLKCDGLNQGSAITSATLRNVQNRNAQYAWTRWSSRLGSRHSSTRFGFGAGERDYTTRDGTMKEIRIAVREWDIRAVNWWRFHLQRIASPESQTPPMCQSPHWRWLMRDRILFLFERK